MKRTLFQGVRNVLSFNWHFFVIGFLLVLGFVTTGLLWKSEGSMFFFLAAGLAVCAIGIPLIATAWAYDLTGLYEFRWLDRWMPKEGKAANIHAGFDESSLILQEKYPKLEWKVYDFYDPTRHTEVSIQRARAKAIPLIHTEQVSTHQLPQADQTFDGLVLILVAHEVRDFQERVAFFKELRRILKPNGFVIVTEHLRDLPNFLAYSIGAFHFHSRREWMDTFEHSGFQVCGEIRLNLFITTFVLT